MPTAGSHLIWCPANGREPIVRFIDDSKHTLFIQNESYQLTVIIEGVGGLRIMDDAHEKKPTRNHH